MFSVHTVLLTYAISATLPVEAAACPFSRTALLDDIVQRLPAASVIAAVEPASTNVSLGDGVGVGVWVGKGSLPAFHPDPVQLNHRSLVFSVHTVLLT